MKRPNHVPPGKAAPRFLNLRTGGNLPKDHGLGFRWIFAAAMIVLIILSIFVYG